MAIWPAHFIGFMLTGCQGCSWPYHVGGRVSLCSTATAKQKCGSRPKCCSGRADDDKTRKISRISRLNQLRPQPPAGRYSFSYRVDVWLLPTPTSMVPYISTLPSVCPASFLWAHPARLTISIATATKRGRFPEIMRASSNCFDISFYATRSTVKCGLSWPNGSLNTKASAPGGFLFTGRPSINVARQ